MTNVARPHSPEREIDVARLSNSRAQLLGRVANFIGVGAYQNSFPVTLQSAADRIGSRYG